VKIGVSVYHHSQNGQASWENSEGFNETRGWNATHGTQINPERICIWLEVWTWFFMWNTVKNKRTHMVISEIFRSTVHFGLLTASLKPIWWSDLIGPGKDRNLIWPALLVFPYKVVPPSYVSWFMIPLTIDISPTKTIVIGVMFTNLAIERGPHLVWSQEILIFFDRLDTVFWRKGQHFYGPFLRLGNHVSNRVNGLFDVWWCTLW
jgi:hypothetical protein